MIKKTMSPTHVDKFINQFSVKQIIEMFDLMSDVLFWVKDENNCFVYANKYFLEHLGVTSLTQIIGLNDFDFSHAPFFGQFRKIEEKKICPAFFSLFFCFLLLIFFRFFDFKKK